MPGELSGRSSRDSLAALFSVEVVCVSAKTPASHLGRKAGRGGRSYASLVRDDDVVDDSSGPVELDSREADVIDQGTPPTDT